MPYWWHIDNIGSGLGVTQGSLYNIPYQEVSHNETHDNYA